MPKNADDCWAMVLRKSSHPADLSLATGGLLVFGPGAMGDSHPPRQEEPGQYLFVRMSCVSEPFNPLCAHLGFIGY